MLEAESLQRVVEFDVHSEIVGIELQLIAGPQAAVFIHVHGECGDAAFDVQSPVAEFAMLNVKENEFVGFNLLHSQQPRARALHDCGRHASKTKYRTAARGREEL